MPWDPLNPTQPVTGRETIARPASGPIGLGGLGDLGPSAGVGLDAGTAPSVAAGVGPAGVDLGREGLHEIARSGALSGIVGPAGIPPDAVTLVVYNPLSKPWFLTFDGRNPFLPSLAAGVGRSHDLGAPGNSLAVLPVPAGATALKALMDNSAPSATDSGFEAVFYVTNAALPPGTSRLS